jgi:hypothetical protein
MHRARMFLKRILTPVTILLVPHSRTRSVSIRVPVVAVAASVCLSLIGTVFVVFVSVRASSTAGWRRDCLSSPRSSSK